MINLVYFLLTIVVVAEAGIRFATFPDGNLIVGINSTGVSLKQKQKEYQILWTEEFNSTNSLKIYFNYFFERSGLREVIELDNLCKKYKRNTVKHSVQQFVLRQLANTGMCPIKKGTKFSIYLPINDIYNVETIDCGPAIAMVNVFRNNPSNPKITPLLISGTLRGLISGFDC